MEPTEEQLEAWVSQVLLEKLPSFHDFAKAKEIAHAVAKLAYKEGANLEFRECCATLGRNLPVWPDWSTADIIRMLKDKRRPWKKGYDFPLET